MRARTWIFRLSLKDPGTGKRSRPSFTGTTKAEAKEKARQFKLEAKNGLPIPSGSQRLGSYLDKWLDEVIRPMGLSINTFDNYESVIRIHIKPALGSNDSATSPPMTSKRSSQPNSMPGMDMPR